MTITTLENIDDFLMDQDGRTWYPYYQYGAPFSFGIFLHEHINDMSIFSSVLKTHDSPYAALDYQVEHLKFGGLPLIVSTTYASNQNGHAVVMTGVEVNNSNDDVEKILYHDPYYGKYMEENSAKSWRSEIYMIPSYSSDINSACCMTMKIN